MKIALVFPRLKFPTGDPPLGVCYLAAYLKKYNDCTVEIIDTTYNKNKALKRLATGNFDIAGISIMTSMIDSASYIAGLIKKNNPDCVIIAGGPHPTCMPEDILNNPVFDIAVIGEGEITLSELIKNKLKNLEDIKGIYFKKNGNIIKTPPREFINDLDTLPFPDLNLLPMEKYINNWFQLDCVDNHLRGTTIITSRGCPYRCTFCQPTIDKLFGKKIRKRSPENIVQELISLKKNFNIDSFMITDDTFLLDKNWVIEVCNKLIEHKLDLLWGCNIRANYVDEYILKKMKQAGLRKIFFGVESASQRILDDIYNKKLTMENILNAVNICKKFDLKIQCYFMIGAPTETSEEIKKTIKFAKNLDIDEATCSITTPLPGTFLYHNYKDHIVKKINEFNYYTTPVFSEKCCLSPLMLKYLKKRFFLEFYLSKKRILSTVKSFLSLTGFKKNISKLKRL